MTDEIKITQAEADACEEPGDEDMSSSELLREWNYTRALVKRLTAPADEMTARSAVGAYAAKPREPSTHAEAIAAAISAKVEAALTHQRTRIEAVLAGLIAHCGGIDEAIVAGVAHSPGAVGTGVTVHLGNHIIWRGRWDDSLGDPMFPPSPPRMEWREEYGPACPADVRAATEAR
jgi:hypothetical protein